MTTPTITDFGDFRLIDWPAFTYLESTDPAKPVRVDKGGRHLGQPTPGVAVPFPTRRHGELHKHFGICEGDNGEPLAYGKGASITSQQRDKEMLVAARIGGVVVYKGKLYTIKQTPNENIELVPAD